LLTSTRLRSVSPTAALLRPNIIERRALVNRGCAD
jgi:hypothetical protein